MLSILATPIGNLEDISFRALRVLSEADFIFCEDTRVTIKILNHYGISVPLKSLHRHSSPKKLAEVANIAAFKKSVVYVTDGGTPGVSDPGKELIEEVLKINKNASIVAVPGPSAVTAAASICGFPMEKFVFLGFPPKKKRRKRFFEEALSFPFPVVFYESPHSIIKSLSEISEMEKGRDVVVMREMTKLYETTYRGTVEKVVEELSKENIKGEFAIVLGPRLHNNH